MVVSLLKMLLFCLMCAGFLNIGIVFDTMFNLGTDNTWYHEIVEEKHDGLYIALQLGACIWFFPGLALSAFIMDKYEKKNEVKNKKG